MPNSHTDRRRGVIAVAALALWCGSAGSAAAQTLLPGEFGDIELGRELIDAPRFPSLTEVRAAAANPQIAPVLMIRLWHGADNFHLPMWSPDGQRLAFQKTLVGASASGLLLFPTVAAAEPTLLSDDPESYDYMFRWGVNHPSRFAFVRIDPRVNKSRLYYSLDGQRSMPLTETPGQFQYPALYERTDGLHWLAFEQDAVLVHQAWSDGDPQQRSVARGTAPRWSRDGRSLLMLAERGRTSGAPSYRVVVRGLGDGEERLVSDREKVLVRSPSWSPDESAVAFWERDLGEKLPWRIQAKVLGTDAPPTTIVEDVVVNPDFSSEGPTWEPGGRRVWCFSHRHRQQEYYPMVAAEVPSGRVTIVDYPRRATVPYDLALNPASKVPEAAFVAHSAQTRDLFVVLFNHY